MGKLLLVFMFLHSNFALAKGLTILHTNDWQSRIGLEDSAAKLATLIEAKRQAAVNRGDVVLLVDGGDFTQGTLFQTLVDIGPELRLMGRLKYDAITLGNHEFDAGPKVLGRMFLGAKSFGDLPPVVISNMILSKNSPEDAELRSLWESGELRRSLLIERGGLRIGIFGLMGRDATEVSPASEPVKFSDPVIAGKEVVRELQEAGADIIILLSHGGLESGDDGKWGGDDIELAEKLQGVDLIVGGHSHTVVAKGVQAGSTLIVQAGSDLSHLGEVRLDLSEAVKVVDVAVHPINDEINPDAEIAALVSSYKKIIETGLLSQLGIEFDQAVLRLQEEFGRGQDEQVLARLVTESLLEAGAADVALYVNGLLRDDLKPGKSGSLSVSDLFRLTPLGTSADISPGYSLIKIYLTARDLKNLLEILAIAYKIKGDNYFPRFSGLRFFSNFNRVYLDRIWKVELFADGKFTEVDFGDQNKLYSLVTSSYIAGFIGLIDKLSYGLLSVTPRDKGGKVLESLESKKTILYWPNGGEIKAWQAVLKYVQNLGRENGELPELNQSLIPTFKVMHEGRLIGWQEISGGAGFLQWGFMIGIILFVFLSAELLYVFIRNRFTK